MIIQLELKKKIKILVYSIHIQLIIQNYKCTIIVFRYLLSAKNQEMMLRIR